MRWLFVLLIGIFFVPVTAQGDEPGISAIFYNATVEETITAAAPFDWWQVQAAADDVMRIQVIASGGLAARVAVLAPNGDRAATSDEGAVNGRIALEYNVPEDGLYTIVVASVGETVGSYTLTLQNVNTGAGTASDVVFMCNGVEMAVLASVTFFQDDVDSYPLYVYGFDGLLPAIRFQAPQQDIDVCHRNAREQVGDVITLPGAEAVTLEVEEADTASQLTVNAAGAEIDTIIITFGAEPDAPGRYLAIVGGFSIEPRDDIDMVQVRPGGLTSRSTTMQVYMVAVGANNRLDPFMRRMADGTSCDDAGRRGCDDVPSFNGAGVVFNSGGSVVGDRFDAGLNFDVGTLGWQEIELRSFSGSTSGEYVLVIVGELPPRNLDP